MKFVQKRRKGGEKSLQSVSDCDRRKVCALLVHLRVVHVVVDDVVSPRGIKCSDFRSCRLKQEEGEKRIRDRA